MKIGLLGYGKMGKLIEEIAEKNGHTISTIFSKQNSNPLSGTSLEETDVCIDFSHAACTLQHIKLCISYNKPLIIGTTGWEKNLELAQSLVESSSIGCLYSPNFSIGVFLFCQIVSYAAKTMASFTEYDLTGIEYHHNQKLDSPSGTAHRLMHLIQQEMPDRPPMTFSSIRCGHIPGTHTIHYDGPADSITLTHTARNREGFAIGAIKAAEWILDKKGFFTMDDFLNDHLLSIPTSVITRRSQC